MTQSGQHICSQIAILDFSTLVFSCKCALEKESAYFALIYPIKQACALKHTILWGNQHVVNAFKGNCLVD